MFRRGHQWALSDCEYIPVGSVGDVLSPTLSKAPIDADTGTPAAAGAPHTGTSSAPQLDVPRPASAA